jgi:hypothetical protein
VAASIPQSAVAILGIPEAMGLSRFLRKPAPEDDDAVGGMMRFLLGLPGRLDIAPPLGRGKGDNRTVKQNRQQLPAWHSR